jgi:hypothetical protein
MNPLNPTAEALLETLLWSTTDEFGNPLDRDFRASDFSEEDVQKLYGEFQKFVSIVEKQISEKVGDSWDCIDDFYDLMQPTQNQAEHDYILTRNGRGCGFYDGDWAREVAFILAEAAQDQGEITPYIGDDGKLYIY